ncbi:hypothetical protein L2U69_05105 [Zavarzinia compransoris]|uniref:hypothetical protein n=1 Tax=Zavarzinia marina TaxID=2911065 RepID=UPI001F194CA8|nr:hypothetical protein [Zavarzinia marina]MCF4165015.1 hypothetical protein [Zavarzinia marina]
MGRIIVIAALVAIGTMVAAWVGGMIGKAQRRLNRPSDSLPRPRGRRERLRDLLIGLGIMGALIVLGLLLQTPG